MNSDFFVFHIFLKHSIPSELEFSDDNASMYKIESGKLDVSGTGGSTITYAIKIWVSSNAPEDIIGDMTILEETEEMDWNKETKYSNVNDANEEVKTKVASSDDVIDVDYVGN